MKALPRGQKYPTESCRYLARDGYFYKDILQSPDAFKKDTDKKKNQDYWQRPKRQDVPRGTNEE